MPTYKNTDTKSAWGRYTYTHTQMHAYIHDYIHFLGTTKWRMAHMHIETHTHIIIQATCHTYRNNCIQSHIMAVKHADRQTHIQTGSQTTSQAYIPTGGRGTRRTTETYIPVQTYTPTNIQAYTIQHETTHANINGQSYMTYKQTYIKTTTHTHTHTYTHTYIQSYAHADIHTHSITIHTHTRTNKYKSILTWATTHASRQPHANKGFHTCRMDARHTHTQTSMHTSWHYATMSYNH